MFIREWGLWESELEARINWRPTWGLVLDQAGIPIPGLFPVELGYCLALFLGVIFVAGTPHEVSLRARRTKVLT